MRCYNTDPHGSMDATAGVFVCYKKRLLKRLSYRQGVGMDWDQIKKAGLFAASLYILQLQFYTCFIQSFGNAHYDHCIQDTPEHTGITLLQQVR